MIDAVSRLQNPTTSEYCRRIALGTVMDMDYQYGIVEFVVSNHF